MTSELRQLRRVRWGVRLTLALGISASLAANVLHARHLLIDQIISGWPPVAVFATIEAIARVPVRRRWLAVIRMTGLGFVAGIAFWVSYWHMASVAATHGEHGSRYLLPLSVDGLVVVSSISLVELTGQISAVEATARKAAAVTATGPPPGPLVAEPLAERQPPPAAPASPLPPVPPPARPTAPPGPQPGLHPPGTQPPAPAVLPSVTAPATANGSRPGGAFNEPVAADGDGPGDARARPAQAPQPPIDEPAPGAAAAVEPVEQHEAGPVVDPVPVPVAESGAQAATAVEATANPAASPAGDGSGDDGEGGGSAVDKPPASPSEAIVWWRAKDPTLTYSQIAAKVGRSKSTVRRVLQGAPDGATPEKPANPTRMEGGSNRPTNGAAVDGLAGSVVSGS